jgi:hypothetical protein
MRLGILCELCGPSLRPLRFKILKDPGELKPFAAKNTKKGRKVRKGNRLADA